MRATKRIKFSVAADGTLLTVTDTNTSQGVDTVSGVETLRFDDGISVATSEDGHVTLTGSDADDAITIGEGISSGLRAEYYINTGGNGNFGAGTLYTTRTDANINFEQMWDGALPSNSPGGNSNFAVRWTGFIKGPADGQVNFYGRHDDGARLVIDGQSIFNNWSTRAPVIITVTAALRWRPQTISLHLGDVREWWWRCHAPRLVVPWSGHHDCFQ